MYSSLTVCGEMPQGWRLGPLIFLILNDDLRLQSLTHKYVDYTTFTELEYGPMPNVTVALPNICGALCSTPQSLADAHY